MTAPHKLLIATDLGAADRSVVQAGLALTAALGGECVLLHVFTNEELGYGAALPVPWLADALELARRKLESWSAGAGDTLVRVGDPCAVILAVADELGAELIVLGTHARRGIGHAVLGSVAESVLRRAHRPVLVFPRARR